MINNYTISPALNPNRAFILLKSELEKRLDPLYYVSNIFGFLKTTDYQIKSIREVVDYTISGFGVGREDQDLTDSGFIQIRPTNLDELGNLKFDRNIYLGSEYLQKKKSNIIRKNDVLFNNTNSQELVGKTAFFDLDGQFFHSNHITRIGVNESYLRPKFLWILLNLYQEKKIFYTLCTNWNNQSGVGIELLNSLKIIIPSFEIQDKIIAIKDTSLQQKHQNEAEVEKLLTSIDDYLLAELGITLPEVPENTLKSRMFTTTLKEVSGGRFDPHFYQSKFKELGNTLCKGLYPNSIFQRKSKLITSGATPLSGGDSYTEDKSLGVPFIRSGEINNIDFETCLYVKPEIHNTMLKSSQLQKGDLLIAIVGATIGEIGVYTHERQANINQAIALVRLKDEVNSNFAMEFLKSTLGKSILDRIKRPVARANINLDEIGTIQIPLPPLAKQKEIADHITAIRQEVQRLKDRTKEALAQASKEIEAILLG